MGNPDRGPGGDSVAASGDWAWPWSAARRGRVQAWTAELRRFRTRKALHASGFWRAEGAALNRLLTTLQTGTPAMIPADARRVGVLRAVQWNIFKGVAFDRLLAAVREHPALRGADLLLLNEVDVGMARSGNRHVAAALAEQLGMHWAFVPSFLELTKGPGADASAPGENEIGLHGVALLMREAPLALAAVALPDCFDYFAFSEKRLGRRRALVASLPGGLLVSAAHLEVRGVPACRARQVDAWLGGVAALRRTALPRPDPPILLAGDLNTHTFPRGRLRHTLAGILRLATTPRGPLRRQLEEPWHNGREPLFECLRAGGFSWEGLNDRRPTAYAPLPTIDEGMGLPRPWRGAARALLGPDPRGLPLRLDWFAGRGITPASAPQTVFELLEAPAPSDHAPLVLEFTM